MTNQTRTSTVIEKRGQQFRITEKKKAELDSLTLEVLDAQHKVEQFEAIVSSLSEKSDNFQGFLVVADNNRTKALSNRNLLDQIVQNAQDLKSNSHIAFDEMVLADKKTKELATSIKIVMDKLIYSAEVINKLANLIIRKKASNSLISDELVSVIGAAGKDANNAVALTLVALKSTFAAQASNMESEAAAALEYSQAMALYELMTGKDSLTGKYLPKKKEIHGKHVEQTDPLSVLLYDAYKNAKLYYEQTHEACMVTNTQLNNAKTELNKAQVKLKSLQTGLAAGNAAALAS